MKSSKNFPFSKARKLRPSELKQVYSDLEKAFGYQHWWPGETAFEVVIGAILTQNTAWTNVEKAISNLKRARKLTPAGLRKLPSKELARLIKPAGYFNVKTKRIKAFIDFLFAAYKGSLRRMFENNAKELRAELLKVHGIGPETADSILLYAGGRASFVIDAYTKRIFGRHKLENPHKDYEDWRVLFEASLPRSVRLYNDFHAQIVHLGKHYCRTQQPRCETCPLRPYL